MNHSNRASWSRAGAMTLFDMIESASSQKRDDESMEQAVLHAETDVAGALGVAHADLTPAQKEFAGAHMILGPSNSRPGFFSIPYKHRKPSVG